MIETLFLVLGFALGWLVKMVWNDYPDVTAGGAHERWVRHGAIFTPKPLWGFQGV